MEVGNVENSSLMDQASENASPLAEETSAQSIECNDNFSALANTFLGIFFFL